MVVILFLLTACATTPGCSQAPSAPAGFEIVSIGGRDFTLELVADIAGRTKGLGGRASIPAGGGMLFSFPRSQLRYFVMRDCLVPIDIIFLDGSGRVTMTHHMPTEESQRVGEPQGEYERRLPRYSSRFAARYAIELAGGTLAGLDIKAGDEIELDHERLAGVTE